ncbi:MAG: hypothetical protein ACR2LI_07370 [Propionibacteriaceae bacterium]
MTAPPSAAPLPADRPQQEETQGQADHDTPIDATSDESGDGQVSEGPNSLSSPETSGGGADALPDTHG